MAAARSAAVVALAVMALPAPAWAASPSDDCAACEVDGDWLDLMDDLEDPVVDAIADDLNVGLMQVSYERYRAPVSAPQVVERPELEDMADEAFVQAGGKWSPTDLLPGGDASGLGGIVAGVAGAVQGQLPDAAKDALGNAAASLAEHVAGAANKMLDGVAQQVNASTIRISSAEASFINSANLSQFGAVQKLVAYETQVNLALGTAQQIWGSLAVALQAASAAGAGELNATGHGELAGYVTDALDKAQVGANRFLQVIGRARDLATNFSGIPDSTLVKDRLHQLNKTLEGGLRDVDVITHQFDAQIQELSRGAVETFAKQLTAAPAGRIISSFTGVKQRASVIITEVREATHMLVDQVSTAQIRTGISELVSGFQPISTLAAPTEA